VVHKLIILHQPSPKVVLWKNFGPAGLTGVVSGKEGWTNKSTQQQQQYTHHTQKQPPTKLISPHYNLSLRLLFKFRCILDSPLQKKKLQETTGSKCFTGPHTHPAVTRHWMRHVRSSMTQQNVWWMGKQLTLRGLPRPLLTTGAVTPLLTTVVYASLAELCTSATWPTFTLELSPIPGSTLWRVLLRSMPALRPSLSSWSARRLRTERPLSTQHGHDFVNSFPGENFTLWPRLRGLLRLVIFSKTKHK